MNNRLVANDSTLERIGGHKLPTVARRYAEANGELIDAGATLGNMHPMLKPKWEQLRALLQKAMGENVENMYDAGRAVLMALGDYQSQDDLNAKDLLNQYNLDDPIEPHPRHDPIHGRTDRF